MKFRICVQIIIQDHYPIIHPVQPISQLIHAGLEEHARVIT